MFHNGSMFEWVLFWLGSAGFILHIVIFWRTLRSTSRVKKMTDPLPSPTALLVIEANVIGEAIRLLVSFVCALSGWVAVSFAPPPGTFSVSAVWKANALIMISVLALTSALTSRWYQRRILEYHDQRGRRRTDETT